jgi:hypothetical protein
MSNQKKKIWIDWKGSYDLLEKELWDKQHKEFIQNGLLLALLILVLIFIDYFVYLTHTI